MKQLALLAGLMAATVLSGISVIGVPESPEETREALFGAWEHRGFYYVFHDSTMAAVKVAGEPKGYRSFQYTVRDMGTVSLIRFGRDLDDTSDNQFLLVDNVTDSTAVFAYPTVFARQDSSKGFMGQWRHTRGIRSIEFTVGSGTVAYREYRFDDSTGQRILQTERNGFYRAGIGNKTGRFTINYDDGTSAPVIPVIFDNVMYLFDLSPRKSLFLRAEKAPSFREFQKKADQN